MSHLLNIHLEQIALSCQGIESLPFPPPRIFTNALLHNNDITSLIRDTEPHERALFSVPPPPPPQTAQPDPAPQTDRRKTVFAVSSGEVTTGGGPTGRPARRNTAVAAVLGGDLHAQLTRRRGGEVDVEVLLRGAEKLCGVYALPGAAERIAALRGRWGRNANTAAYYEARVAEQTASVERTKGQWAQDDEEDDDEDERPDDEDVMTEEDLRAEEEEVRELERKKRELQARLRAMDEDLGGLLHM